MRGSQLNVDLARYQFSQLSLQIRLEVNDTKARTAWNVAGFEVAHVTEDGSHFLEMAGYRRRSQQYRVLARLITGGGDVNPRMLLDYSERDPARSRWLRTNLDRLGNILDDIASPCVVRCSAMTTYDLDDAAPLLALPLLRFTTSDAFFDEIRGIRLARLAEDGSEVDNVALDMDEHGHLHVYTTTSFETVSSSRSPIDAVRQLVSLRGKAVELK